MSHELKAITGLFVPSGSLIQGTLASGTVTSGSIGSAAVLSGNIASGQVGTFHIASGAITGDLIASGAVNSVDLADNSVVSGKIASGSVSWFALGSGVVNSGNLGVNSVVSGNIASGAVGLFGLASGVVVSGIIGNNAVNSGNISSGAVGLYQLGVASGTVEGTQLTLDPDTGMMVWSNPSAISTRVKNGTGAIISGLAVVYISGGGGANPFVAPALANADATSLTTFGVATSNIGANAEGTVVTQGILTGVNTSAFNDGDVLWLSPTVAGGVTTTKPQAPNHLVLVGYVTNAANNGTVEVAIQNGYELEELHDVKILSGSLQSGQVLQWSSGVWWNQVFVANSTNIGSGAVTSGAIASGQIGPSALASGVIAGLIVSGSVQSGDLGTGVVTNVNIASGTISNDKLVNSSITIDGSSTSLGGSYSSQALTTSSGLLAGTYYPSGALTIGIASGGILAQMMGSGSVTTNAIASGSVTANALASGAVSDIVGSGSVTSGDLGIGAVNNLNVASGTLSNDKLVNSSVTIAGSNTSLGGSWEALALTTSSGLLAGTYYPSGSMTIGIASGGITSQLLADNAVASGDVAIGAINNQNISSGTVANDKLANNTVTIAGSSTALGSSWAAQSLTAASGLSAVTYYPSGSAVFGIASGGIIAQMMGSGSVTTNAIASGSVTANALASGAVSDIVGSGSVTSGDLGIGAINNLNVASGTLSNDKLVNSSITIDGSSTSLGGSHSSQALTTSSGLLAGTYYPSGSLTIGIASGGIVAQMMGSGSVTTNAIASGSITANLLASGAVTDIVGSGSVTSGDLGIGSVNNLNVASGTLSNDKLANSSVTIAGASTSLGGSWAALALTTSSGLLAGTYYPSGSLTIGIASGGITSQLIADEAVTTNDIASGAVGTNQIASGAVTGTNIAATTVANVNLVNSTVTIAGSSTALGSSWAAAALTTASGLLAGTYYPSGALTIGIASGGIVAQMMGSGSVTTNAIASGSITANLLASGAVSDIVGSGSVTSGDLGIGAVNNLNVASGTLSNDKLVNSTITIAGSSTALGGIWAAASLTAASGLSAVTYYPSGAAVIGIASGGVSSGMLANASVVSGSIGSGQIGQYHLASGAANLLLTSGIIVSGMVGNNSITSGNISSGSLGQMHMSQILLPKVEGPGRLSLFSGAPIVSGGYISGADKLYYNPYKGNTIALYDGASWLEYEINVPLMLDLNTGLQSGTMYDIFMTGAGGISGTASLSAVNWTSGGNRAPIVYQNGIPLSQFTGGRYLGTIRTTTNSTSEDSPYRRFVWNYDNRITNTLYYTDSTQHTYNSPTPRVWNLNSGSRLEFVQGVAGIGASTSCFVASYVTPGATSICSFESDGVFSGTNYNVYNTFTGLFWSQSMMMVGNCNVGYNYLQLMESCQSGTVTNVSMTLTGTIEG